MEFIQALKDIVKKNSISFTNQNADKEILLAFRSYCESDDDILQFQEYKNIIGAKVLLANELYEGYFYSKKSGDKHFRAFADKIESLSDELEKNNISCFSYAYFMYAFIKYYIEEFKDNDLKNLGISPVKWLNASSFDLSDNYKVTDEDTFCVGRYKDDFKSFTIEGGILKKYTGKSAYVIVPNFINGIDNDAFAKNKNIRSVYIPKSVLKIGSGAFENCENLETVVLSEKIISLNASTFENCRKLKRIDLKNIQSVGNRCFKNCVSLVDVDLSSLTKVGNESFSFCSNIKNYDFVSNLVIIGEEAFRKCGMEYITLSKCEKLGKNAFLNCNDVSRITIENDINTIGSTPFNGCVNVELVRIEGDIEYRIHQLFNEDVLTFNSLMQKLTCIKKKKLNDDEFSQYAQLIDVEVMDGDSIPDSAFKECSNLKNIKFNNPVTFIGNSAFENCTSLVNLDIKYLGDVISKRAFYKCQKITSFEFLNNVSSFDYMALAYTDLTSFNFNRKFEYVGPLAFANCKFPDRVSLNLEGTKVFPGAFHGLKEVKSLKIRSLRDLANNELFLLFERTKQEFNDRSKINYLFIKDSIDVGAFQDYKNIRYIEWDIDSDGIIPSNAFKNCFVESIKINGLVSGIDTSAFENCKRLSNLSLECDKLKVMDYAFAGCPNASNIIDLSKITYFGKNSFASTNIRTLNLSRNTRFIGKGAFSHCSELSDVTLPFAGESENNSVGEAKYFGYIFSDIIDQDCNIQKIQDESDSFSFYLPKAISKVTILSDKVKKHSFDNCYFISEINLPNIKSLKDEIFSNCVKLKKLFIGEHLQEFSAFSISNCPNLENIFIDEKCRYFNCQNGNVTSKDNTILYYLNKKNKLSDYINTVNKIVSGAVQNCCENLNIKYDLILESRAIDGSNIKELTISNLSSFEEEAIYHLNNIKELTVVGKAKKGVLSTDNKELSLNVISVYKYDLESISSLFNENISFNTNNLELSNLVPNQHLLDGFKYVENLKCFIPLNVNSKIIAGKTIVKSLFANRLSIPVTDIFENKALVSNINSIEIKYGNVEEKTFAGCKLSSLKLGNINEIKKSAFKDSVIDKMSIYKVDHIQQGAFADSTVALLEIKTECDYQIIDSILYSKDMMLYCFNKSIEELVIPDFVKYVGQGVLDSLSRLRVLSIPHSDIRFENDAIKGCSQLSELNISNIKNKTIREFFADNGINIKKINYHDNFVKKKYFSELINLQDFNSQKLNIVSDMAFANCKSLLHVDLSAATSIGDMAFYNCNHLRNASINHNCKHIGLYAFEKCTNLSQLNFHIDDDQIENNYVLRDIIGNDLSPNIYVSSNIIPSSYFENYNGNVYVTSNVEKIGSNAFNNCKNIIIQLNNVTEIGERAFAFSKLEEEEKLNSIVAINKEAFLNCEGINSLYLGRNLKLLGEDSLKNIPLRKIRIDQINPNYISICNCVIDVSRGNILTYVAKKNSERVISLDSRVKLIKTNAFDHINTIEKVNLSNIAKVENQAFVSCNNLKSISISNSNIGSIICDCPIEEITIDKINVFEKSDKISDLFADSGIPNTLKKVTITGSISDNNFDTKSNIEHIIIPENVMKIPDSYFANCLNLRLFNLPKSCQYIGQKAFSGCKFLDYLDLRNIIYFGELAFDRCFNMKNVVLPFIGVSLTDPKPLSYLFGSDNKINELKVLSGTLSDNCFLNCDGISSIVIPQGINKIGDGTFKNMISLIKIENLDNVEHIGKYAFQNCKNLANIVLSNVRTIDDHALDGCSSLKSISLPGNVNKIGKEIFLNTNIKQAEILFDDKIRTLNDYGFSNKTLTDVTVNSNKIFENSFKGFAIEKLTLNHSITSIPSRLFKENQSLNTLVAYNVEKIGAEAFKACFSLKNISIDNVKYIENAAFENSGISGIINLGNVINIGARAFAGTNIQECNLGVVEQISEEAFMDCINLSKINLEKVKSFGKAAFKNTGLTDIKLSNYVKVIPKETFNIKGLKNINIPTNLVELGDYAFAFTSMKGVNLYFPNSLRKVGKHIFFGAESPVIKISKKHNMISEWDQEWDKNCKRYFSPLPRNSVKVKYLKDE